MYSTVLVPADGSDASLTAAKEAVDLTASDGTLHALYVVEDLPMYRRSAQAEKFPDQNTDREAAAERVLSDIEELTESAGVECVTTTEEGVPHRGIVEYAEAVDAEAIVLGKRGRSEVADDMLGSTTQRVVKETPTTVVAVPAR